MNTKKQIVVLQLCEHFGGQESSLHGVARGFQWWMPRFDAERFRVLLCSRKGRDKAAEQMIRSGVTPSYLGYGKLDPRNLFRLVKLIREEKVDIIHAHGYGACFWGRIAGHLLRIPVIVHERCNYKTVPLFQRPAEFLLGPFTRYAFAVSESTKQFCVRCRHMKEAVIDVLYNGLPLEDITIRDDAWRSHAREELGAGPGQPVTGIVCRLEAYKGLLDAFQAFASLRKEVPDALLWVAGDGTYEPVLRDWIREHGMGDHIRLLGFRADVRDLIQCFDVQLFPSHQEGTPNTLYEALAVGQAIVASTTDGQGEILEEEKTALLFEPGDVPAMAEKLKRIYGDEPLRRALREKALERGKDFDGRKCIDRMQAKYEQIMADRKKG